ncbi:hypothetical protein [Flavilitoribacter nigricans]|uniref:Lipoprotein n=1 Tax=Flavilitoribacter nigricans (strain ATCC 23147 / DSM 23189 / NBRC 102662 / NCIMB 1420 / SS-2) TaxID=1122177 RepID=A0A2D0N571_FLAN2|nr:hypothetical protein [Flavilitoribacter nigricans]PHN03661.1 hypothetical protein CRP01_25765 [Flavilitoribacter nigricans DSM 23189 = NBRC 102662]
MKKCALFLMCCLSLASCVKDTELSAPPFDNDQKLEVVIEADFNELTTSIRNHLKQLPKKELMAAKDQLENGVGYEEINPYFSSAPFQSLQVRLVTNLKSLSYYQNESLFEAYLEKLGCRKKPQPSETAKSLGTPCYDAWDLQMASVTAGLAICLGYSPPELLSISKCVTVAALAAAVAEVKYHNCMEQYEY